MIGRSTSFWFCFFRLWFTLGRFLRGRGRRGRARGFSFFLWIFESEPKRLLSAWFLTLLRVFGPAPRGLFNSNQLRSQPLWPLEVLLYKLYVKSHVSAGAVLAVDPPSVGNSSSYDELELELERTIKNFENMSKIPSWWAYRLSFRGFSLSPASFDLGDQIPNQLRCIRRLCYTWQFLCRHAESRFSVDIVKTIKIMLSTVRAKIRI